MPPTNPQAFALLARSSPRQLREPDRYLQPLIPQKHPLAKRTRHQDQCTASVTFKTARTRLSNPDRYYPVAWFCRPTLCCLLLIVLEQPS